jgi:hypothetical protein
VWDAFKGDVLPQIRPLATGMTPAEQALAHIESLHILARNQVAMERWLANHDRRFGITSYKQVPAARFACVMQWFSDYGRALEG